MTALVSDSCDVNTWVTQHLWCLSSFISHLRSFVTFWGILCSELKGNKEIQKRLLHAGGCGFPLGVELACSNLSDSRGANGKAGERGKRGRDKGEKRKFRHSPHTAPPPPPPPPPPFYSLARRLSPRRTIRIRTIRLLNRLTWSLLTLNGIATMKTFQLSIGL